METKQKYLRDIRDAINGVETSMPGVAGESEATYLRDIAKAIRSSGIDPSIPKVTDVDNGKILKVVNGVWAKADDEGVLYGEETPASTLGKDGDLYLQKSTTGGARLLEGFEVVGSSLVFSGIYLTDIDTIRVHVVYYDADSQLQLDENTVTVTKQELRNAPDSLYPIMGTQNPEQIIMRLTYDPYHDDKLGLWGRGVGPDPHGHYKAVVDIDQISPEPTGEVTTISDIYLKVDGKWIKDEFGKDKEPEQPESISLLHLDEDFVNDQITDAKGNTYSIMTGTTGVSMTNETKKFGEKCLSMNGQGWVNSEILGDKLDFKNGDFTIDLWVKPNDTWRMCPICLPGNGLLIDLEGGIARIWFVNEDGQLVVHADGGGNGFGHLPVPPNVWTHIAYVREGDYVALFVNGNLDIYVYIGSINKQYIPESSRIRLGNWENGDLALYTYSGYIDEVRVTNKAMWHIFGNGPTEPYTK